MSDQSFNEQRKEMRAQKREVRMHCWRERKKANKRGGGVLAGLVLLCIGAILLLKEFGVIFPAWLFTWPMIIITVGLFIGAGSQFRDAGWVVITGVGAVFLMDKIWPGIPITHFIWPIVIIAIGLIIIISSRRHRFWHKYEQNWTAQYDDSNPIPLSTTEPAVTEPAVTEVKTEADKEKNEKRGTGAQGDSWLDIVAVFGGVKKLVYSKDFKGGDMVAVFGGGEINLLHADFTGTITIDIVAILGGAKLIVPPHWQIRSDAAAIFGGIEDKRTPQTNYDPDKVLVIDGTVLFGGIEIKSY